MLLAATFQCACTLREHAGLRAGEPIPLPRRITISSINARQLHSYVKFTAALSTNLSRHLNTKTELSLELLTDATQNV